MNEGEEATLLAVALAGEETYWLCQPVHGKRLPPEWKHCICHWLYIVDDADIRAHFPWYTDNLGVVLELGVTETSKVERFAVISDSVRARKIVSCQGGDAKTYFILGNEERDVLDVKFEDLLKRESTVSTSKAPVDRVDEKPLEEMRPVVSSSVSEGRNGVRGGNSVVFTWDSFYIVEYGNRVFYVCSAPHGNKHGFKVERLIRKGITIFLLFQDDCAGPCRVSDQQEGERATVSSVLEGERGKVMVLMTEGREVVPGRSRGESLECSEFEPPTRAARMENPRVNCLHWRPLRAAGVNLWVDFKGTAEAVMNLAESFPFSAEFGGSVRTTVFSDGTCVTYNLATASKFAGKKKAAATSTDCDMVGLLENIQLAKEQFHSI
ncbi:uncharacterized protein Tco025E_07858 [Trypanosoma conorhini]|uniref:Uncharacterized protein n=1 Tax=Trypanosoma conorhini TaxID=83891 RepID=A0A3R7NN73_9TRYP|nr:uncharacterized protein Tco025E_07858 [Trypanosoma conorhini]RNF05131.1 hypothetical protein Tco025E_07858 [Trypanosoma conorhini]